MSRRKKRNTAFPVLSATPLPLSLYGWAALGEPLHWTGLEMLGTLGLLTAVMMPAVLVSIADAPKVLVPARWRAWWRQGVPREEQRSSYIPVWLRRTVLTAGRYRCCWCHSHERLQVDHIRPWSAGGLAVFWNLAVLCGPCNRLKSNYWVAWNGYEFYQPFEGADDIKQAAQILRHEKFHRWAPGRWLRAGWALAA